MDEKIRANTCSPPGSESDERHGSDEAPVCAHALVVVTGGSKGIGRACVESFARRGARVLFTYRSDVASAKCIESAFQPVGRVQGRYLDQGNFDSVRKFAKEVNRWREGLPLDIVVNNAGLGTETVRHYAGLGQAAESEKQADVEVLNAGEESGIAETKQVDGLTRCDEAYERAKEDMALMRVNALGPMWVTEALLPMMREHGKIEHSHEKSEVSEQGATMTVSRGGTSTTEPMRAAMKDSMAGKTPTPRKKTILFIGSVGGGSQSVFPGFRVADGMSKAALAYACKHFAARSNDDPCFFPQKEELVDEETLESELTSSQSSPNTFDKANGHDRIVGSDKQELKRARGDGDSSSCVDFVCLCPGATLTDMFRASTLDKMCGIAEREHFMRAFPRQRLIQPQEIAEVVFWLCSSPAASIFHGAVLDGSAGLAVRPGVITEYPL